MPAINNLPEISCHRTWQADKPQYLGKHNQHHSAYDWPWVVAHAPLVVDTVNVTTGAASDKVMRLGAPLNHHGYGAERAAQPETAYVPAPTAHA